MSTSRGRPPRGFCLAGGIIGPTMAHCSSVRSDGYFFRDWFSSTIDAHSSTDGICANYLINLLFCQVIFSDSLLQHRCPVIFPCKPDPHPTRYARVAWGHATDAMAVRETRRWTGRSTDVPMVRSLHDVLPLRGDNALSVHWFELPVANARTGEQRSHNSGIINQRLTVDNVGAVAQARRGRWKKLRNSID